MRGNTERARIESIRSRVKGEDSILEKLESKSIGIDDLNDMAGVRVICSFIKDIYDIKDAFLKQDDIRLLSEEDYIKEPKPSGYRSLHLNVEVPIFLYDEKRYVQVEVQIRTIAMDFWASLDHKISYKKDIPEELREVLSADMKKCADDSAILDQRMQDIKD